MIQNKFHTIQAYFHQHYPTVIFTSAARELHLQLVCMAGVRRGRRQVRVRTRNECAKRARIGKGDACKDTIVFFILPHDYYVSIFWT